MGLSLAEDHELKYFEASAKTGLNVDQIYQHIAEKMHNKPGRRIRDKSITLNRGKSSASMKDKSRHGTTVHEVNIGG